MPGDRRQLRDHATTSRKFIFYIDNERVCDAPIRGEREEEGETCVNYRNDALQRNDVYSDIFINSDNFNFIIIFFSLYNNILLH